MKKILKKVASKYVDSLHKALQGDDESEAKQKKPTRGNLFADKDQPMVLKKLPGYFLIFAIMATLYMLFIVIEPFLWTLLIASILTILFYGVYTKINKALKMSRFASILTCLLVVLIIVIPILGFIALLAREAVGMYDTISEKVASGSLDFLFEWETQNWYVVLKEKLDPFVNLDQIDFRGMLLDTAQDISSYIVSGGTALVKNIGSIGVGFVIMLFSMFYLFKDGDKFVDKLTVLSPLPRKYEKEIIKRIGQTVRAIAYGVFLTAVIQGAIAGIGFAIAGVSNPIFWATATAVFSIIPLVGTAAIWFPAVIILAVFGNYWEAVFLFAWGVFVVGTVDNLVRPLLIGSKTHTYPLLTFFVVLGGIFTLGLKGLIFGPIVMILLLTLLHIYEIEYKKVLDR